MTAVVAAESLSLHRGAVHVLDDVSLAISPGEIVALLGPSGSGKSTLVRVLLGLDAPEHGTVSVRGEVASQAGRILIPPERRDLAVVFQDLALWPHMTVAGNLRFALRSRGASRAEADARIDEVLRQVDLADKAQRRPAELSGGEQQRVAIARALALRPTAILLDEPLSNLDVVLATELAERFASLFAKYGTAALYVTHDPRQAEYLADRLAIIESGRITQVGAMHELRTDPSTPFIRRAFVHRADGQGEKP